MCTFASTQTWKINLIRANCEKILPFPKETNNLNSDAFLKTTYSKIMNAKMDIHINFWLYFHFQHVKVSLKIQIRWNVIVWYLYPLWSFYINPIHFIQVTWSHGKTLCHQKWCWNLVEVALNILSNIWAKLTSKPSAASNTLKHSVIDNITPYTECIQSIQVLVSCPSKWKTNSKSVLGALIYKHFPPRIQLVLKSFMIN